MRKDKFVELDQALKELRASLERLDDVDASEVTRRVESLRQDLYDGVSRWSSIEIARHPQRPCCDDYIAELCDEFYDLHGDRCYGDDPAIRGGLAKIAGRSVVVIAHKKRSSSRKDNINFHNGMASPSGHNKVVRLLKLAEKFGHPVVTLVDTPGAYPIPEAEYKGQALSIANCIATIADLKTPVIACIVGEGGSGGALAIGFGDRMIMCENSFYSVISPESYASIVYRDTERKEEAAEALKGTGADLLELGIIDRLVQEPVGGAHNEPAAFVKTIAKIIKETLDELQSSDIDDLLRLRDQRINALAPFV